MSVREREVWCKDQQLEHVFVHFCCTTIVHRSWLVSMVQSPAKILTILFFVEFKLKVWTLSWGPSTWMRIELGKKRLLKYTNNFEFLNSSVTSLFLWQKWDSKPERSQTTFVSNFATITLPTRHTLGGWSSEHLTDETVFWKIIQSTFEVVSRKCVNQKVTSWEMVDLALNNWMGFSSNLESLLHKIPIKCFWGDAE